MMTTSPARLIFAITFLEFDVENQTTKCKFARKSRHYLKFRVFVLYNQQYFFEFFSFYRPHNIFTDIPPFILSTMKIKSYVLVIANL